MKIGVASPFMPHQVADHLDAASKARLTAIRGVPAPQVTALVRGWLRQGHQVSVFCLDPSVATIQELRGDQLSIHVLPKRRARHYLPDFYRTERRLIREAIRRERPDVISAQWTYEHALGALECGIPTAVTCQDTPLRYAWISKHWFTTYHLLVAWRVIRRANRLVCISPYTAEHIQKYFRPRCPVDVVPNGIMPEVFDRGGRRMQQAGARPGSFSLCSVGGWGKIKNNATLLKAFSTVRRRHPSARLALFGREVGPDQAAERWARRRNLQHGVEFKGSVAYNQVLDFLETEADLMVHPSLVETQGLVLVEAMACGVPVIGGLDSGAVAWTLEGGRSGYLCDVGDERALGQTIIEALEQPDRNRDLVKRAWDSAKRRFNQEQVVNANVAILQQLLTASSGTPK
ncbi:MAG: glycosyltransferase family 4 protein [Verrucomicrobiota bacterium]|jgi:glycosyltransferase involved in cell wall biosynthesis